MSPTAAMETEPVSIGPCFHPACLAVPVMSEVDLAELVEDIKDHGQQEPIVKLPDGQILDGRSRYHACELAGVKPQFVTKEVADPLAFVISANIRRRHLTGEQKRLLIERLLKANPEQSDRAVAKLARVDHKTVASVRAEQANGEIPHKPERTEASGRKARGRKPKTDQTPAAQGVKAPPTATSPKSSAEPKVPASRIRDDWVNATGKELNRDFHGTVQAFGKLIGERKAKADELSQFCREQLLEPIAKALAGPQRVLGPATPAGVLEP